MISLEKFFENCISEIQKFIGRFYVVSKRAILSDDLCTIYGIHFEDLVHKQEMTVCVDYEIMQYYNNKKTLEETVVAILDRYNEEKLQALPLTTSFDGHNGSDYPLNFFRLMKSQIFFKLINTERNAELLKNCPSSPVMDDMSIVYYLAESTPCKSGIYSHVVTNEIFKKLYIRKEMLHDTAVMNTCRLFKAHVESAFTITLLTNMVGINGGSVILYPSVLKNLAEKFNSHLWLIPISVHKWGILPCDLFSRQDAEDLLKVSMLSYPKIINPEGWTPSSMREAEKVCQDSDDFFFQTFVFL